MEPFSFILQAIAAATLSVVPAVPASVPGSIETVTVSNSYVITETADRIEAERIAEEKRLEAERIAREKAEAERLEAERIEAAKKVADREKLSLPLATGSYVYTSDYGLRCLPVGGVSPFHNGMDLAAPLGTPIKAIADGVVTEVTDGINNSTVAGVVAIESTVGGKTITFTFLHMGNSSQYVKVGDTVKAGDHVADVASTGLSTGAHLHLEVWEGNRSTGKHIDPEDYFKEIGLDVVGNASGSIVTPNDNIGCGNAIVPINPVTASATDIADPDHNH